MFRTNVMRKWYEVTLCKNGRESRFRIDAESEESARLATERNGWKAVRIIEVPNTQTKR